MTSKKTRNRKLNKAKKRARNIQLTNHDATVSTHYDTSDGKILSYTRSTGITTVTRYQGR